MTFVMSRSGEVAFPVEIGPGRIGSFPYRAEWLQIEPIPHGDIDVVSLVPAFGSLYRAGEPQVVAGVDKSAEIELISQAEDNPELRFCLLLKIDSLLPRVGEGDPDTQLGSCLNVESGNRIVLDQ